MVYSRNYEGAALTPRAEEPQSTVEPREREEPREPTTCASRAGRLIRSRATRRASGEGHDFFPPNALPGSFLSRR